MLVEGGFLIAFCPAATSSEGSSPSRNVSSPAVGLLIFWLLFLLLSLLPGLDFASDPVSLTVVNEREDEDECSPALPRAVDVIDEVAG